MTALPSELVAHILDLAIPSPSFGTNSERTSLLKRLALLSHDYLPFARFRLYEVILLGPAADFMVDPDRSAQRLVATLRASPPLARLVRVLRFRKARGKRGPRKVSADRLEVEELLRLCVELEEVLMVEVEGVQLASLSSSPKLRSLMLHETDVSPVADDQVLRFLSLTTLELSNEYLDRSAYNSFPLTPYALPSLRDVRASRCILPTLLRNATAFQLSSLALTFETMIYASDHKELSLPIVLWDFTTPAELWGSRPYLAAGRGATIRYIPSPQVGGSHEVHSWRRELSHALACPAELKTIILPDWLRTDPGTRSHDLNSFLQLCDQNGVDVVFEYQGRPFEAPRISPGFTELRRKLMLAEGEL